MQGVLEDPGLVDQLIPKWAAGCRRITPGVGYLESLKDEKTTVIYGGIAKISPEGCVTEEGKEYPVDVLVCAVSHL
jgi:cation diffusion facilitator CzcD-associated flavoprotein CzcO